MDISVFYTSLGTVGLIIMLGFFLGKKGWISEHTNKQLINILLMVAMPAAMFGAFPQVFSQEVWQSFLWGLSGGAIVLLSLIILAKIIFHKRWFRDQLSFEGQFAFIFNNASFLGFPLISTLFPHMLVPYAGFILVFNIALFSYGVWLFEQKLSWKFFRETITNPNIVAVFLAAFLFLISFELPRVLNDTISYVGRIMTPMSLLCIGYMLSRANFLALFKKRALFLTALLQLTIGPTVTFFVLLLIGVPAPIRDILVLIQALPTATSLGLFAEKYNGNPIEASELVLISTTLSIITLPIMIRLLII